jgi:hypothetical protein
VTLIDRLAISHAAHSKYLYTYCVYSQSNEQLDVDGRMTVDWIDCSFCFHVNMQVVLCTVDKIVATSVENFMSWKRGFTPEQGTGTQYVLWGNLIQTIVKFYAIHTVHILTINTTTLCT